MYKSYVELPRALLRIRSLSDAGSYTSLFSDDDRLSFLLYSSYNGTGLWHLQAFKWLGSFSTSLTHPLKDVRHREIRFGSFLRDGKG